MKIELGESRTFEITHRKFWVQYEAYEPGRIGVSIYEDTGNSDIPSLVVGRDFRFSDIHARAKQFISDEIAKLEVEFGSN